MSLATFAEFGTDNQELYSTYLNVFFMEVVAGGRGGIGQLLGDRKCGSVEEIGSRIEECREFATRLDGFFKQQVVPNFFAGSSGRPGFGSCQNRLVESSVEQSCDGSGNNDDVVTSGDKLHCNQHTVVSSALGPNTERNRALRAKRKAAKARKRGASVDKGDVPEWRRKSVGEGTREALEKMWISKNKVATLKYEAEAKRLEACAANSRPFKFVERKPKTQEELDLEAAERVKRLKQRIEKHDADIAYWKKRQDSGAIDKAIALENEILDGQLSGKYDPFASRRMLGWAKTVKTHGSGTGSGSGSSGSLDKTVWSGSGATTKTDLSVLEQKVAVYEEKLKKSEKDNVELGKKADMLNKQLITVTVESERKDKELFEVKKFKEYLEKAKKEKKRRADNEFEAFRTQADCSY